MPDVDPVLTALQAKVDEGAPIALPAYLGRSTSVAVVDGPKLRFVLSSEVAYHELDIEWATVAQLYAGIKALLGDAVQAAEDAQRDTIAELENQARTLSSMLDARTSELEVAVAAHEETKATLAETVAAVAKE